MSVVVALLSRWRRRLWIIRTLKGPARLWALRRYRETLEARVHRMQGVSLGNSGRVVFICHGNIMRSAFATQVAKQQFPPQAHRFAGGGTHAVRGRAAQESALRVSRVLHAPLDGHEATPLSALALDIHDVVVCMDAMNEANVLAAYPMLAERVFRVGDIVAAHEKVPHDDREVRDPYGTNDETTRDAFDRISHLVTAWMHHLLPH